MKKLLSISSLMLLLFLAGCASSATIANVGIPGSAKEVGTQTIGKNSALHYLSDLSVEEACATQLKLLVDAKWTESEAMKKEDTYSKATYTDGKSEMVLLCNTTEISATAKSTRVNLTLMKDILL